MLRRLACVLALLPGFWLASAQALGLGEIDIRSKLNQRFAAVIPVSAVSTAESESLVVRLANAEDFSRAGIERVDFLSSLEFALAPDGNQIRVSSKQAVRDPFLNFIVEARWSGGRLLREYTVLLDPPADPSAAAPASPVVPLPAPVQATPPAPAPAPQRQPAAPRSPTPAAGASAAASSSADTYGPVKAEETLWSIATRLRPSAAVSMDQMLLALYEKNPGAFAGGIDGLLKGSRLKVPSEAEITAVDAATAKARVDALHGRRSNGNATPPAAAAPATPPAAAPAPSTPAAPAAAAPATAAPGPAAPAPSPAVPPSATEKPAETAPAAQSSPPASADAAAATGSPLAPATAEAAPPPASEPATGPTLTAPSPAKPDAATAPAADDEGFLGEYQWPLLGLLVLLLLILFVISRIRRSREEEAAARGTPPLPDDPLAYRSAASRPTAAAADDNDITRVAPVAAAAAAAATTAAAGDTVFRTPVLEPQPAEPSPRVAAEGFDQALKAEAKTVAVTSESADPITEADFHLAYRLYDEAAQLLKHAIAKNPERLELLTKLAETYFAAGKPFEFQETAEKLQPRLGTAEWEKIAAMGRQLSPNAMLFRNPDSQRDPGQDGLPPLATMAPSSAPVASDDLNIVEFDLDAEIPGSARLADHPESFVAPPAPHREPVADIDLSRFDLDAAPKSQDDTAGKIDFHLDELDLAKFDESDRLPEVGDEIDTKLDLARAYADMGDNEAARSLLGEVLEGGSDKQKREAETLQKRLSM